MTQRVPDSSSLMEKSVEIIRLLRANPMSSEALQKALNVSQPTLSRIIQKCAAEVFPFRIKGMRSPQYGLIRRLPKMSSVNHIYRITKTGNIEESGTFVLLSNGNTFVNTKANGGQLYEGLPPSMTFSSPAGFMGRTIATEVSKYLDVPSSLGNWTDDHKLMFLTTSAPDIPGNYIFGNASLALMMEQREFKPIAKEEKLDHYVNLANSGTQIGFGSSAGGEQPKFTCELNDLGHVIVKFAKAGSRTAELLIMENLAQSTLIDCGLSAAKTDCFEKNGITFLEVQRFDRIGRFGRLNVISAGSLDDELFGCRDNWSEFAVRCLDARMITASIADNIHTISAFGKLIGNTDMHFENIAMMLDDADSIISMAPAYDMLPMQYASVGSMDPLLTPVKPTLGSIGGKSTVWSKASESALKFWNRVVSASNLSMEMREIAKKNIDVVQEFVDPLVQRTQIVINNKCETIDKFNIDEEKDSSNQYPRDRG